MEIITYSLRGSDPDSDRYYRECGAFTDRVIAASSSVRPIVESFRSFITRSHREDLRSGEEYLFELLMLGTLWRIYCDDSHELPALPRRILIRLAEIRREHNRLKPAADLLRGILATLFLVPQDREWMPRPTLRHLDQLLAWMAATGDYQQEVRRLEAWREFWSGESGDQVQADIAAAIAFAEWFDDASIVALGMYTSHVEQFLLESQPAHRWKEDVVSSARRRVEYHLNMVGAEIMNRAFRNQFLAAGVKVVVLPSCMRLYPKPRCMARPDGLFCQCKGCASRCQVNQVMKMGRRDGFEVRLAPHESAVFSGDAGSTVFGPETGVVGVTCITNLISGGWKARSMGIPPQCVLLDHCGCRRHWHDQGIPTEINIGQLKRVLEVGI